MLVLRFYTTLLMVITAIMGIAIIIIISTVITIIAINIIMLVATGSLLLWVFFLKPYRRH